jgi:phosphate transport system permease protein
MNVNADVVGSRFAPNLRDSTSTARKSRDKIFLLVLWFATLCAVLTLFFLILTTLLKGAGRLNLDLLRNFPSPFPEDAGIQSAIFGTLAGVPSIVFGILGLAFVARGWLGWGFSVGTASAVLTMMVLPVVVVSSREALKAVPPSLREGSYALGATKWQTIRKQVIPAAVPGIATGSILGVSRALGESAPLILLGALAYVSSNPSGYSSDYTVLPLIIMKFTQDAQDEFRAVGAAAIIVLLVLLVSLNLLAIVIRDRSRKSW